MTTVLDIVLTFFLALTGGLVARRAGLDAVGFVFLATIAGTAGGTARDLTLGREIFWVKQPPYLLLTVAAGLIVFVLPRLIRDRQVALGWLDLPGLAAGVAAGAGIALEHGEHWLVVLAVGVMNGTFGGLVRDTLADDVPLVLSRGESYAVAALSGPVVVLFASLLGLPPWLAMALGALVAGGLRAVTILRPVDLAPRRSDDG